MAELAGWFIALCWVIFLVYIVIAAFAVKRTVQVDRLWKWSWLILLVVVAIFSLKDYGTGLRPYEGMAMLWQRTLLICIGADILALAGLIIGLWGRLTLGRNWNIYPGLKEDHELIERGPYAYVRHPMYTGLLLLMLGTIIWYGAAIGLIVFIFSFLGTWLKLSQEEKILTKHFGESYTNYKARVKVLIPFVL